MASFSTANADPSSVLCIIEGKYVLEFPNAIRADMGSEVSSVKLQNGTTVFLRGFHTCIEAYKGDSRAVLQKIKPAFKELSKPIVIDMGE